MVNRTRRSPAAQYQDGDGNSFSPNHHYIPQFIISYWITRTGTRKLPRRRNGRPRGVPDYFINTIDYTSRIFQEGVLSTREVYSQRDYYKDSHTTGVNPQHIESAFGRLETEAAPIIRRLHSAASNGQSAFMLDNSMLASLCRFLFVSSCRTEEQFWELAIDKSTSSQLAAEIQAFVARHDLPVGSVSELTRAIWLHSLHTLVTVPLFTALYSDGVLPPIRRAYQEYSRMHLVLYRSPAQAEFLLCEGSIGARDASTQDPSGISYPLTPRFAIVAFKHAVMHSGNEQGLSKLRGIPHPHSECITPQRQFAGEIAVPITFLPQRQVAKINRLTVHQWKKGPLTYLSEETLMTALQPPSSRNRRRRVPAEAGGVAIYGIRPVFLVEEDDSDDDLLTVATVGISPHETASSQARAQPPPPARPPAPVRPAVPSPAPVQARSSVPAPSPPSTRQNAFVAAPSYNSTTLTPPPSYARQNTAFTTPSYHTNTRATPPSSARQNTPSATPSYHTNIRATPPSSTRQHTSSATQSYNTSTRAPPPAYSAWPPPMYQPLPRESTPLRRSQAPRPASPEPEPESEPGIIASVLGLAGLIYGVKWIYDIGRLLF